MKKENKLTIMNAHQEKEEKWRTKMQDWTVAWICTVVVSLALANMVFDGNLFHAPIFKVMLFFWVASISIFLYLAHLSIKGMEHRYRIKDDDED